VLGSGALQILHTTVGPAGTFLQRGAFLLRGYPGHPGARDGQCIPVTQGPHGQNRRTPAYWGTLHYAEPSGRATFGGARLTALGLAPEDGMQL
jgi:hypothetical protein